MEQALDEGDTFIRGVDEITKPAASHKNLGGKLSFKTIERHLTVRVAMLELQEAFNCTKHFSQMKRADGAGGLDERYDYISSLFEHVDALSTVLLTWKSAGVYTTQSKLQIQTRNEILDVLLCSCAFIIFQQLRPVWEQMSR